MTRSYAAARASRVTQPLPRPATRCVRDPSIHRISFTPFRLVAISDPEPDEGAYAPVELMRTSNTMSVFVKKPGKPWR